MIGGFSITKTRKYEDRKRRFVLSYFRAFVMIGTTIGLLAGVAQAKTTAADVLSKIEKNYKEIHDYRADLDVTVNSPQIHVSNSKATIYFKRPDKVKLVAKEGFLVLPKDAILSLSKDGDPVRWMKANFDITYEGDGKVVKEPVYVLRLEPKTIEAQGRMKVLVEKRRGVILKTEAARAGAKFTSTWSYVRVDKKYWMPEKVEVEMSGTFTPGVFEPKQAKVKPPVSGQGKATVKFSGYRVNKGISDKVFESK